MTHNLQLCNMGWHDMLTGSSWRDHDSLCQLPWSCPRRAMDQPERRICAHIPGRWARRPSCCNNSPAAFWILLELQAISHMACFPADYHSLLPWLLTSCQFLWCAVKLHDHMFLAVSQSHGEHEQHTAHSFSPTVPMLTPCEPCLLGCIPMWDCKTPPHRLHCSTPTCKKSASCTIMSAGVTMARRYTACHARLVAQIHTVK